MLDNLESKFLAAQNRTEDLRRDAATRGIARAVKAEKRRSDIESRLSALKERMEGLEARASSTWENQRRQAVHDVLFRLRGA